MTVTGLSNAFSALLGINITLQETPLLYNLVEKVVTQTRDNCIALQQENPRTAPYTRLNDKLQPGTSASSVSSYPSCHAAEHSIVHTVWYTAVQPHMCKDSHRSRIL